MRALYAALKGWQDTAPEPAVAWLKRVRFVHEHSGWTYRDYDEAEAGDILLDQEYLTLMHNLRKG